MIYSPEHVNEQFEILEKLLPSTPLDKEDGTTRIATADEFMFMTENPTNGAMFKHRDSRNYIYLKDGKITIPKTNLAFTKGTFDYYEGIY